MDTCQTEGVPQYCTCGAMLPPDARFCHKCAKPQYDYPGTENTTAVSEPQPLQGPPPLPTAPAAPPAAAEISFRNGTAVRIGFLAALLAVLATGLITSVFQSPAGLLFGFFGAGLLAPLWYKRRTGQQLSVRSGARIGWITGVFLFVILLVLSAIMFMNLNTLATFRDNPAMQKALQDFQKVLSDPAKATETVLMLVVTLFLVGTTLPMLGGALGARLSDKRL
jgi:hypothetical protein